MGSREEILGRIHTNTGERHARPDLSDLKGAAIVYDDIRAAFGDAVKRAGGTVVDAGSHDPALLGPVIRKLYPEASRLVTAPGCVDTDDESAPRFVPVEDFDDPALLDGTDVAVVKGHFGVAENGAVWITGCGRHRAMLFIAEALVIILPKDSLVNNMHEAYDRPEMREDRDFGTFISGPSKTADIEQALVFGAHGARNLTVILI